MNFYDEIKNELIDNEVYKRVKDYSKKLTIEFGKNYSIRLLYRILKFYRFVSTEKMPTLSAKLSWSHYDEILRFDDINKVNYYIKIIEEQSLSIRKLREKIKNREYERLPKEAKAKLINKEKIKYRGFY